MTKFCKTNDKEIVASLSRQLTAEYGKGFTNTNLVRIRQFAELFPDIEIAALLTQQLTWAHFVEILPIKHQLKRDFFMRENNLDLFFGGLGCTKKT